jgi:hypothetical protein
MTASTLEQGTVKGKAEEEGSQQVSRPLEHLLIKHIRLRIKHRHLQYLYKREGGSMHAWSAMVISRP